MIDNPQQKRIPDRAQIVIKLSKQLRHCLEKELEANESIRWIEQPIPRFLTRNSFGICLGLLLASLSFSFAWFALIEQAQDMGMKPSTMIGPIGIFILLTGIALPLILIICIPIGTWLEARQTVYVITDHRAFSLFSGWATKVWSFLPGEL